MRARRASTGCVYRLSAIGERGYSLPGNMSRFCWRQRTRFIEFQNRYFWLFGSVLYAAKLQASPATILSRNAVIDLRIHQLRKGFRDPELSCPCRRVVVYPKCGSEPGKSVFTGFRPISDH
jgi:hypothetical protein